MNNREQDLRDKINVLTSKLQGVADTWKQLPADEYNRRHDKLTEEIDKLIDQLVHWGANN